MIQALIVDDEHLVRKGLRLLFPWEKYGVEIAGEAASGEKAMQLLREKPIQLLMTDITMPGMSGLELIRQAQQHDAAIKVVILTCHQDFEYIQAALRMGAIDYIVKTQLEEMDLDQAMERIVKAVRTEAPEPPRSNGSQASLAQRIAETAGHVRWVMDDDGFASLLVAIGRQELDAGQLGELWRSSMDRWQLCFPMFDWQEEPDEAPGDTYGLEQRLRKLRARLQAWLRRSGYSEDIIQAIVKAVSRIAEQPVAHVKQSEVSQWVNLSKNYFSTSFRDIMRVTFSHFLQTVSVRAARELLVTTNYPVYWIAERCGFADQRYFSKLFKEQTGLLPSEYRQRHGK
ncbi:response regulator transcription factor [Cohnella sp. JJ-181]|uniref:response regulator transcription factor n=1 Tax=Cohnella rhizoplanae TaxID=2974897 RepID=UPI0022FFBF43|nr:response regulator [Cohnella sp. JJ-181]CAI6083958.1 Protein-glutamate methylesterase/protein-glutamine glutaminase [Cohnella sp. JJ-181]